MDAEAEGSPFGRYRLIEVLGSGGMGEVWRAYDTMMRRDVAVKVLPTDLAAEPGYEERFRREAYTAARLAEPHIIPIHEAGDIDGRLYLVMPVIEGIDLQRLLRRDGPINPKRTVMVIEQLASALDAAHAAGLVHRDVKPSNALLTGRDFVYLIDFGIAHDTLAATLTRTGSLLGTLAYTAPERFESGAADASADIYALAAVLHECLTGNQPFPGDSLPQLMRAHLHENPPRPSAQRQGVPAEFDEVVAQGMAKNPDRRFATAKDLADAAHAALSGGSSASGRSKPPHTREFSQRWPNPEGTGSTPYRDHLEQAAMSRPKRNFGAGQMVLAGGAAALLAAALVVALWLSVVRRPTESPTKPSGSSNATPSQSFAPASSHPAINSLPGTDRWGFVDFPGARCDPPNEPAVVARTTLSVLVVCQVSPGSYYYRAVRTGDRASIELANAVRSSDGFDVTNPADGSLRQVRPTYVRITFPGGLVQTEPIIGYASR